MRLRRILSDIMAKIYALCSYYDKLRLHESDLALMGAALRHRSTYRREHSLMSSAIDMGNLILCDLCHIEQRPRSRALRPL